MASANYTDPLQKQTPNATQAAKETARSMLNEQQKAAASGLGDFAGALRKVAREMGDGRQAPVSRMVESAADGLERLSGSLREKDLNGLMRDVEGFARRQPVAFFGAALAAGFVAMRFLKSSDPRSPRDDNTLPY
jgi:hypothetical protein